MSIMQLYQYYMEGLVHKRNRLFVMSRKLLVRVKVWKWFLMGVGGRVGGRGDPMSSPRP